MHFAIWRMTSHSFSEKSLVVTDGNAETDSHDDGAGTMEALYFGSAKGGLNHGGAGAGVSPHATRPAALSFLRSLL